MAFGAAKGVFQPGELGKVLEAAAAIETAGELPGTLRACTHNSLMGEGPHQATQKGGRMAIGVEKLSRVPGSFQVASGSYLEAVPRRSVQGEEATA